MLQIHFLDTFVFDFKLHILMFPFLFSCVREELNYVKDARQLFSLHSQFGHKK